MAYGDPYEALGIHPDLAEAARLLPIAELAQAAGDSLLRTEGALPTTGRGPDFGLVVPGVIKAFLTDPTGASLTADEATAHRIAAAERLVDPLGLRVVAEVDGEETAVASSALMGEDWPPQGARQDAALFTTTDLVSALAGLSGSERTRHLNVREDAIQLAFGALLDQAAPERNPLPPDHDLHPDTVEAYEASRERMARADAVRLEFAARIARALGHRQVPDMKIDESVTDLESTTLAGAFVDSHAEAHNVAAGTAVDAEELLGNILTSPRELTEREKAIAYEVGLRLIGRATRPNGDSAQVEGQ